MKLIVEFTQDQYDRYQAAMQRNAGDTEITDAMLTAQLKREAAAITYGYESSQPGFDAEKWKY